jgi:hypothetical protein
VTAPYLAPLAPRLLIGVDHIPSRWAAQSADPGWVCVGASSHDYVLVSAHPSGEPCAGCVHPRDEAAAGEIPIISFVSFWVGLIQALELVAHAAAGHKPGPGPPTSGRSAWTIPAASTRAARTPNG